METNVSYTVAGTFILVLLGFLVFAVIWLSAGFQQKEYNYYMVYMNESISGLSKDGPVEFNGVDVGNVKDIKISTKNPQIVILTLEVEKEVPITMGTKAKLGMRALTGVAYLLLEDKGTDMRPLRRAANQPYPVIPTTPSILVRLETTLTQLNDSFRKVSTSIGALLNKHNLDRIRGILDSGKDSMDMIKVQTLPETNETISNIGDMARDLSETTSEIKDNPSVIIRGKESSTRLGPGET